MTSGLQTAGQNGGQEGTANTEYSVYEEDLLLDLRWCHRPHVLRGHVPSAFLKTMTWNPVDEKKNYRALKNYITPEI